MSREGCNKGNKKGGVIIETLQPSDRITDEKKSRCAEKEK